MDKKLTLLERYWKLRLDFESFEAAPPAGQILVYSELLYRISVLETCQMLVKAAPFSNEMSILIPHYQVMNAYIEHIRKERHINPPNPEKQKQQQTALAGLSCVIDDCRKRYGGYIPKGLEQYQKDVGHTIAAVLPAWVQYRNTITEIKIIEEASK